MSAVETRQSANSYTPLQHTFSAKQDFSPELNQVNSLYAFDFFPKGLGASPSMPKLIKHSSFSQLKVSEVSEAQLIKITQVTFNCLSGAYKNQRIGNTQYVLNDGEISRYGDKVYRLVKLIRTFVHKLFKEQGQEHALKFFISHAELETLKSCRSVPITLVGPYLENIKSNLLSKLLEAPRSMIRQEEPMPFTQNDPQELPENLELFTEAFNRNPHQIERYVAIASLIIENTKRSVWSNTRDFNKINTENITSSRFTCMYLFRCNDYHTRKRVLKFLITLLEEGIDSKEAADGLLSLQIELLKYIELSDAQQLSLKIQRLLIQAYARTTTNILIHSKELNGLLLETKEKIKKTASNLAVLNVNNDPEIAFWIAYADQAAQRLVTNSTALWMDTFSRIGGIGLKIASIVIDPTTSQVNILSIISELKRLYDRIPDKLPWFDELMILSKMAIIGKNEHEIFSLFIKRCQQNIGSKTDENLKYGIITLVERAVKKTTSVQVMECGFKLLLQMLDMDEEKLQIRILEAFEEFTEKNEQLSNTAYVLIRILSETKKLTLQNVLIKLTALADKAAEYLQAVPSDFNSDQCLRGTLFFEIMRQLSIKGDHDIGGCQLVTALTYLSSSKYVKRDEQIEKIALLIKLLSAIFKGDSTTDIYGNTPYHIVVEKVREFRLLSTIKQYVACDINAHDNNRKTALQYALDQRNVVAIIQLSRYGASHCIFDGQGNAPIHNAVLNGDLEMIGLLLDLGSNINLPNALGLTPLDLALKDHNKPIANYLVHKKGQTSISSNNVPISKDENPLSQDVKGNTNLHNAIENGNVEEIISLITTFPQLMWLPNHRGLLPIELALEMCNPNLVQKMIESYPSQSLSELDMICKENTKEKRNLGYILAKASLPILLEKLIQESKSSAYELCGGFSPIHIAALQGDESILTLYITLNLSLEELDGAKNAPAHYAALKLHHGFLELIGVCKSAIEIQNRDGRTPLHLAAAKGSIDCVRTLINHQANVNAADKKGDTPLHIATKFGRSSPSDNVITLLIEADRDLLESGNQNLKRPLHIAAGEGQLSTVQLLVSLGANTDAKDAFGMSPLQCAAQAGHTIVVEWLLQQYVDILSQDTIGETALHKAAYNNHIDILQLLVESENKTVQVRPPILSVTDVNGENAFHEVASGSGSVEAFDILYNYQTTLNRPHFAIDKDIRGNSPLHRACESKNYPIAKRLIELSPKNINTLNNLKQTPLHIACIQGSLDIIHSLIDQRANIKLRQHDGKTPLQIAVVNGNQELVTLLLSRGASIFDDVEGGGTLIHLILAKEELSAADLHMLNRLLHLNPDFLGIKDKQGRSAFYLCALNNHLQALEILMGWLKPKWSSILQAMDHNQKTAADIAKESKHGLMALRIHSYQREHIGSLYRQDRPNGRTWTAKLLKRMLHTRAGRKLFSIPIQRLLYAPASRNLLPEPVSPATVRPMPPLERIPLS